MWTTSSFRADALVVGIVLTAACTTAPVAPEAPRAPLRTAMAEGPPAGRPSTVEGPVEVDAASIRPAASEPGLLQRFGRLSSRPEDLLVVDVRTQRPLGDLARSAQPVIVLNERPLLSTIVVDQTRLIAVVPIHEVHRGDVVVAVTRLGDSTVTSQKRFVVRVP